MKKKTYIINHIPIQIWVNQKMLKNTMKKRLFIIYQRTKVQKLGSPKNEKAKKT